MIISFSIEKSVTHLVDEEVNTVMFRVKLEFKVVELWDRSSLNDLRSNITIIVLADVCECKVVQVVFKIYAEDPIICNC